MKLLAIEKEVSGVDWSAVERELMNQEARDVYQLYLAGQLREHYFNQNQCAVLMLECANKAQAQELLATLPLVRNGLIEFEVMELHPYTGYDRIMNLTK